ncbi:acyl-CoA N-acyltransferase [Hypoxylon rubiginosum]|uniref:Acyl-CoA N-acyltransferase n=1 Tax=Hypoxylon rubiginosum TaxID=110542 RepID=A0ACB9ZE59_9PEZI|nr:acyl-CoA N-acyltransferase [Hypoxylon rubiginosum]
MESSWTFVETTIPRVPLPPNSEREPIRTERLVIRPMREDDLLAYHGLRSQPEAMTGTMRGRPDRDVDESRAALRDFLSPNDEKTFLFGVFLASTDEFIGEGGVHTLESSTCGWPEIGYKFRKEFWGRGYATEFLGALLEAWWRLPRSNTRAHVASSSIPKGGDTTEQVTAIADVQNIGSRKVLEKLGFIRFVEWTEPDTQEHRLGEPVTLVGYRHVA